MATQGREEMFQKILVFFAVVTAITAIFNLAQSGAITIGNFGSDVLPGQAIPNLQVPDIPGYTTNSSITEQDYTLSTGYDLNTTIIKGGWFALGPYWTQADGIGMTCTNIPILPPSTPAFLLIKGVQATDNIYSVTYTMNAPGQEFNIIIYRADPQDPGLYIKFDSTGAHLFGTMFIIEEYYYPGANNAHTIKTEFNTVQKYIDLWIDGNYVFRFDELKNTQTIAKYPNTFYAGVTSYQTGVIVEKIETKIIKDAPDPGLLYSLGFDNMWNLFAGTLNAVVSFGSLIAVSLGMTSNPAVPFWLWAIVGLPCVATTILIYLEMIRGN